MDPISPPDNSLHVLLIEDNLADIELTSETLAECKILIDLKALMNGVEGLKYLRREAPFDNARRPDLVLLDLNLPGLDGREILAEIKTDPQLQHIPVVILTTSEAGEDIVKSYASGANCYITKPVGLDEFAKLVRSIENFWFTVVKLPTQFR